MDALPDLQISDEQVAAYRDFYTDLIGFVPPRIMARTDLLGRLDPELLEMQERIRKHCMYPGCFDVKTTQLMLFGMLLMGPYDASKLHGIAARKAGANWEELSAMVNLAFLFRGLSAANYGAQVLQQIAQAEAEGKPQEPMR